MWIFYLLLIAFGLCILSYKGVAQSNNWRIGTVYYNSNPYLIIFGVICFIGGTIKAFFEFEWYLVIGGFILSWILGMTFTKVLKEKTQFIAPLFCIICLITIFILHLIK